MKPWANRPIEVRNLFNPAYCGLVIHRALAGYEESDPSGMPFSLSLLVLPLSLHKDTRDTIAPATKSYFLKTIERHPQLAVGFAKRVSTMIPFTFEGLGLLMQGGCFTIDDAGRLKTVPRRVRKSVIGTNETVMTQRVARYLGKEFGRIGDRVTIYTALGVRP